MLHRLREPIPSSGQILLSQPILLALAWITMQAFIYSQIGIVTVGEPTKYIYQANLLLRQGSFSSTNFYFYSTTILLLALGIKFKAGYFLLLCTQLAVNAATTIAFYKLCRLYGTKTQAGIISAILILHYPFQEFNMILQTESLFFSFTILYTCMLFITRSWTWLKVLTLILLASALILTRPSGILIVVPTLVFFYFKFFKAWVPARKIVLWLITVVAFTTGITIIMRSGGELNFLLPLIQEHIICGVPTNLNPAGSDAGGPAEVIAYILNNPGSFTVLAIRRSVAFFGLIRNYYSTLHNISLLLLFVPIYILAVISLRSWWRRSQAELLYLLTVTGFTWMMVIFTCDDWHNRFIIALTPLLLLIAMPAIKLPALKRK